MNPSDDRTTTELPATETAPLDDWFGAEPSEAAEPEHDALLEHDELLLAAPPSNVSPEELDAALSSPPPSARSLRLTKLLGVGLVIALAFVGGIALGQRTGQSEVASLPGGGQFQRGQGFPSGFPSGAPGGAGAQAGAGGSGEDAATGSGSGTAASSTTGTVKLVDGSVLYVSDAEGNLTRVEVDDSTDITTSSKADLDDISTGDTVTVTGATTSDGVTATSVEVAR